MPIKPVEDFTTQEKTDFRAAINAETSGAAAAAQAAAVQRANHTGEQAISTVTGLQTAIDGKLTNSMSTGKLLGRGTAGTGTIEEIALGTNLSLSGTTLNATGGGTSSYIYATDYGVVGDADFRENVAVTGTSMTCAGGFPDSIVGKAIRIPGAGTPATATVTVSGGVITGATLTNPGSAKSYTPNSKFDFIISDNSTGIGGAVEATVAANGSVASIAVVAGGSGYAAPTLTAPTADLLTTVVSKTNSTTVVLADAASVAVTGKSVIFGTDNSAAIQSAVAASVASPLRPTVKFPVGIFMGNFSIENRVHLEGSGAHSSGVVGSTLATERRAIETLMAAYDVAQPIIKATFAMAATVEKMAFNGTADWKGTAIRIGIPYAASQPGVRTGFVSQGFRTVDVNANGFDACFHIMRSAEYLAINCTPGYCNIGWIFGDYYRKGAESYGACDGTVIMTCSHNGPTDAGTGTIVASGGSKNLAIIGGDFNNGGIFVDVGTNSNVSVVQANVERCTQEIFRVGQGASLSVDHLHQLNNTANTVSIYGTGTQCSITNTTGVKYRTTNQSGWANDPLRLGYSGVIELYTDTTWTTLVGKRWADRAYSLLGPKDRLHQVEDKFYTNQTTSPFGELGWTITGLPSGYGARKATSAKDIGWGIDFYATSSSDANAARAAALNTQVYTSNNYECEFDVQIDAPSTARTRFGLYSNDGTVDFEPLYGIGVKAFGDVDTTIKLEIINNGVITEVDTGLAISNMSGAKRYRISRDANGTYLQISGTTANYGYYGQPLAFASYTGVVNGVYAFPSVFAGAVAGQAHSGKVMMRQFSFVKYE